LQEVVDTADVQRLIDSCSYYLANVTPEERNALIEARADLVRASSRMLTAKILDPDDYRKLSEASFNNNGLRNLLHP